MRSTVRVRLSATDVPFLGLNSYLLFTANKGVREAFDKLVPTQLLLRRTHAARLVCARTQMHRLGTCAKRRQVEVVLGQVIGSMLIAACGIGVKITSVGRALLATILSKRPYFLYYYC